jgi:hypothetical protein
LKGGGPERRGILFPELSHFILPHIKMKVLNTIHEDYHIHSLNYSDGMNTIDEIVQYAGKI